MDLRRVNCIVILRLKDRSRATRKMCLLSAQHGQTKKIVIST